MRPSRSSKIQARRVSDLARFGLITLAHMARNSSIFERTRKVPMDSTGYTAKFHRRELFARSRGCLILLINSRNPLGDPVLISLSPGLIGLLRTTGQGSLISRTTVFDVSTQLKPPHGVLVSLGDSKSQ